MAVFALGFTGGSGAPYGMRVLDALVTQGHDVHLVVSVAGEKMLQLEANLRLGKTLREKEAAITQAIEAESKPGSLRLFDVDNHAAQIASGSFPCAGMAIAPCSMGTAGRIAAGVSSNLIERAADVMLKERRRLVLVPRETPLNDIHLENLLKLRRAGADILPAMPAFYNKPRTISDMIDFIAGRILDRLGVDSDLTFRWGGAGSS